MLIYDIIIIIIIIYEIIKLQSPSRISETRRIYYSRPTILTKYIHIPINMIREKLRKFKIEENELQKQYEENDRLIRSEIIDNKQEINDIEARIEKLNMEKNDKLLIIQELNKEKNNNQELIDSVNNDKSKINDEIRDLEEAIKILKEEIEKSNLENEDLRRTHDEYNRQYISLIYDRNYKNNVK